MTKKEEIIKRVNAADEWQTDVILTVLRNFQHAEAINLGKPVKPTARELEAIKRFDAERGTKRRITTAKTTRTKKVLAHA